MPDTLDRQAEYFRNRLVKRDRHLKKWARREAVECYRVYDRDIPEIPLAVDRYGPYVLVALYERPYDKPEDEERRWLDRMSLETAESLAVPRNHVFLKRRKRQKGNEQYERFSREGREIVVREGGLSFYVNLSDYLDTGLFLDHRTTRSLVRSGAKNRKALNLFCYTGSFSAYAAAGGATSVDSVDLSNTYLEWAARNMRLNGFADERYRFIRQDALEFLADSADRERRYDLVILDPPTFSNSKRMRIPMDVTQDWPELVRRSLAILSPGGVLWFSTNSRRFRFDEGLFPELIVSDRTLETTPPDYEGGKPHRCWSLEKPGEQESARFLKKST